MKIWALGKHEEPKGEWLVCLPGPPQGFLLIILQEGPEVGPIWVPVAGSPPADQRKSRRPGQDLYLITKELNQSTLVLILPAISYY